MSSPKFIPFTGHQEYPSDEMTRRAVSFYEEMQRRRTVRQFSNRPVSRDVIEQCIRAAATAPSGANLQPWHFVVISDPSVKRQIRLAAEEEEKEFYTRRAPKEWLEALAPLGTDEHKEFLEIAPYLIAVFVERYGELPTGAPVKHYYPKESVGIACGVLITAIQQVGLASLTHTPSPMKFLNQILGRPGNESPFLLLVVGYPAKDAIVPDIKRKRLEDVCTFV
ncbi:MAG TPA: nitroreductase family protein [Pyrinomonadaceae bacterium]|nr:nitroreductase family protein [Pyrinomonadaceae bacterium]